MAGGVVDRLEVIEIERDAAQIVAMPARQVQRALALVEKRPPRHDAGQCVGCGENAQLQLGFDDAGEIEQNVDLGAAERPRPRVHRAQRADAKAAGAVQRRAGVEAHKRAADDIRIVAEAGVVERIGHDQQPVLGDRNAAERYAALGLGDVEPLTRLEPLAVAVEERHRRHLDRENLADEARYAIERLLARRVEHIVARELIEHGRGRRLADRHGLLVGQRRRGRCETQGGPGSQHDRPASKKGVAGQGALASGR